MGVCISAFQQLMGNNVFLLDDIQELEHGKRCLTPLGDHDEHNHHVKISHIHVHVDFNLVQLFTANIFSIKKQKRYNGKYTHYT
jgi:Cdc6-like AAA superfamily ATPase